MASNFITNNKKYKSLKGRLRELVSLSSELKFLVGFFYFSGWEELYDALQKNEGITLKLLVGLQVDKMLNKIIEHGNQEENLSHDDYFAEFISSLGNAVNNEEMDNEAFYNQVEFFLEMLQSDRLLIRKTENPNHAKLYICKLKGDAATITDKAFITGSSNLTRAGLEHQEEFNVEIKDYGTDEAEAYFDELWKNAVPITEDATRRKFLIDFIRYKSQAATVTPFEAYALILKTYIDLQGQKQIKPETERLLEENEFKKYTYQIDAVNQALSIIDEYNGVIIADVVGLGKSVIASLIAKNLGRRGMVICPPGLIGNKHDSTGWWEYINRFKLYDWEVESRGQMETLADSLAGDSKDIEVIIVDEAHNFRNQDTADYEALMNICRGKIVILLTATPFNNSPADIFSLLKLFIVPGKSGITLEENIEASYSAYDYRFKALSDIAKNSLSLIPDKRIKAENLYRKLFGLEPPIDIKLVREETRKLANQIKSNISPVVIRRNRLDLQTDFEYAQEVTELSQVQDPIELFYELLPDQSEFYDKIINDYFGEEGQFTGAIYQPFQYETKVVDASKLDEAGNRAYQQQRNLYDFMRRLLVKRFESSFGAFAKSIDRFLRVHEIVLKFIQSSAGKYILDRKLIEKIYQEDEDAILEALDDFEQMLKEKKAPKNNKVYDVNTFHRKDDFLNNIQRDLELCSRIKKQVEDLDLVNIDPKRFTVLREIRRILADSKQKNKVVIFSEYVDTVNHLKKLFEPEFKGRALLCEGKINKSLSRVLNENFNAQYKGVQTDNFDLLITSDKLSEGFNLNRSGVIINYDIPWNPTRVIQRVGRINRIGKRVFDELYIYNFFPSLAGADVVKSREIAGQKMFMIHNALGEDSKIFEPDEEPSPSALFKKINQNPEADEELTVSTLVRNRYSEIEKAYPETIKKIQDLPNRVKSAKAFGIAEVNVLRKKGLSLFSQRAATRKPGTEVEQILFEELLPRVACEFDEKKLQLSKFFWPAYEAIKQYKPSEKTTKSEVSLENKANNNLKAALKFITPEEEKLHGFTQTLIKDIRYYHTLPKYTLRRLCSIEIKPDVSEKDKKEFLKELRWVMNHLGKDYLELIIAKTEKQSLEVIIAVENIENPELFKLEE